MTITIKHGNDNNNDSQPSPAMSSMPPAVHGLGCAKLVTVTITTTHKAIIQNNDDNTRPSRKSMFGVSAPVSFCDVPEVLGGLGSSER